MSLYLEEAMNSLYTLRQHFHHELTVTTPQDSAVYESSYIEKDKKTGDWTILKRKFTVLPHSDEKNADHQFPDRIEAGHIRSMPQYFPFTTCIVSAGGSIRRADAAAQDTFRVPLIFHYPQAALQWRA